MKKTGKIKTKKPIGKRWWVWVLVILFLFGSCGNESNNKENEEVLIAIEEVVEETTIQSVVIEETTVPTEEILVEEAIEVVIIETEPEKKIVYVYTTPYGAKYHRSSCRHIQDSILTSWDMEEVPASYEPCGTCKPNR